MCERRILATAIVYSFCLSLFLTAAPDPQASKVQGPDTLGNPLPVISTPAGASGVVRTFLTASSATAASANNVTLTATAGTTVYCTGFEITGAGATSALDVAVTLTGTIGGTLNYVVVVPAGATIAMSSLIVEFTEPVPASATNTNLVLNVPSFGVGNTNVAVTIHGFKQ